jgi:hypothetical protein
MRSIVNLPKRWRGGYLNENCPLETLAVRGLALGVISNGRTITAARGAEAGSTFPYIAVSCEVGCAKPAPDFSAGLGGLDCDPASICHSAINSAKMRTARAAGPALPEPVPGNGRVRPARGPAPKCRIGARPSTLEALRRIEVADARGTD